MSLPIPKPTTFSKFCQPVRVPVDVCPHCKRQVTVHSFETDGHVVRTFHCSVHRDVPPMRSIVVNEG